MKYLFFAISALIGLTAQAQTTALLPWQPTQFTDNTGRILAGGKVCTYVAGTSTGLATYTDSTGTVSNSVPPNAIVLDSTGRANIWLSQDRAYKINLYTAGTDSTCSTGTLIRSVDQITAGMAARYTATSIPTTGTWQTGDYVANSTPSSAAGSASAVLGWVCTSGGTPGTWVPVAPIVNGHIQNNVTADGTLTVTGVSLLTGNGSAQGTFTAATAPNYIASETGSNNAIAGALTDAGGTNVPLVAGLCVTVKIVHTLQAGADTFTFNGTAKNIKSHFNVANNIGTAYAGSSNVWSGCYDGTQWEDSSE
jgi:hypothetical protein